MTITLAGDGDYQIRDALQLIVDEFSKKNDEINVAKIDCEETPIEQIISSVQNTSLFSSAKLVVLKNLDKNKDLTDRFDQVLSHASTTTVVIIASKIDKRSQFFKRLKSETDFREFNSVSQNGLANWIVNQAKSKNAEISNSDADFLVDSMGANQILLDNELNKLIAHDKNITKKTIELLCEPTPQASVFQLMDSAFSGDGERALRLYDEQRAQKAEPIAIIGLLAWQLHILAIIKSAKNIPIDDVARKAKISPFVVQKSAKIARSISMDKLKQLIKTTLKIDVQLKTEAINADDAMKHLILQMADSK